MNINRDYYLNQLIEKQGNGLVKIISGIRRCGKSYLLDPMFKNYLLDSGVGESHIIKLDLDSIENDYLLEPHKLYDFICSKIIDSDKYYILLDEIQKVDKFESVLNGLLKKNVDIFVTGSNSKFLSKDIITEFRGRGDEIKMYPLSFKEFYSVYKGSKEDAFNEYLVYGGLPITVLTKTEKNKMDYLNKEKKRTYLKDVIDRNKIQNVEEFDSLVEVVSSSVGSLTNPLRLSRTFSVRDSKTTMTDKTIYNYLSYLEDAFIIETSKRFDIRGKKYIETPYKIYFTDLGIRNSFINFRQIEENHLMENIIYNELKMRGYSVDIGVVEIRDNNNKIQTEIDFICNLGNKKYYIQSTYSVSDSNKRTQELRPLLSVRDFFKKIVITKDGVNYTRDENGILYLNIFEFLLNENSLDL